MEKVNFRGEIIHVKDEKLTSKRINEYSKHYGKVEGISRDLFSGHNLYVKIVQGQQLKLF